MEAKKNLSTEIKQKAIDLGFDACGITPAVFLKEHNPYLKTWLENGFHGQMDYMEKHFSKRIDPSKLFEKAKSVIVVLKSYNSSMLYPDTLKVSKYAQGLDYHYIIKDDLNNLLSFIQETEPCVNGRSYVDSAPILERALAHKAGLGWIGKNSMLINKKLGSFFFIGEIILDLELSYDEPFTTEHCGNCTLCVDNCPTKAIIADKVIDAQKCISYLTIEKRGEFSSIEMKLLNDWIFGCDICQNICPWNKKAKLAHDNRFIKYLEELKMPKKDWMTLSGNQFKKKYKSSPLQRAGFKQILRNIFAND